MDDYTPEPWYPLGDCIMAAIDENSTAAVARVLHNEADVRRIAACVNACKGIRTEALETRAHLLKADDQSAAYHKQQCNKILAVLNLALACLANQATTPATHPVWFS